MPVPRSTRATSAGNSGSSRLRSETLTAIEQVVAGALPGAELLQRGAQDEARQRLDQPGLLGERDELAGRQQALLGVQPAHERLDADDRRRSRAAAWAGSAARARRGVSAWRSSPRRLSRVGLWWSRSPSNSSSSVLRSLAAYIAESAQRSSAVASRPSCG